MPCRVPLVQGCFILSSGTPCTSCWPPDGLHMALWPPVPLGGHDWISAFLTGRSPPGATKGKPDFFLMCFSMNGFLLGMRTEHHTPQMRTSTRVWVSPHARVPRSRANIYDLQMRYVGVNTKPHPAVRFDCPETHVGRCYSSAKC